MCLGHCSPLAGVHFAAAQGGQQICSAPQWGCAPGALHVSHWPDSKTHIIFATATAAVVKKFRPRDSHHLLLRPLSRPAPPLPLGETFLRPAMGLFSLRPPDWLLRRSVDISIDRRWRRRARAVASGGQCSLNASGNWRRSWCENLCGANNWPDDRMINRVVVLWRARNCAELLAQSVWGDQQSRRLQRLLRERNNKLERNTKQN